MSIMKYKPFADLDDLGSGLRLFQDTVNRLLDQPSTRPWAPAVDIFETENELLLKADLPGIEMKDIDIQLENGTLALRGERKFESEKKEGGFHRDARSVFRVFHAARNRRSRACEGRVQERRSDREASEEGTRKAAAD